MSKLMPNAYNFKPSKDRIASGYSTPKSDFFNLLALTKEPVCR